MSVINQMNRDLKRRDAATDKQLAPVLTNLPWWHSPALYKSIAVLVVVGLTLVSGYLLWFAKPLAPAAVVQAPTSTALEQQPEVTSVEQAELSPKAISKAKTMTTEDNLAVELPQVSEAQTSEQALEAQSQAMLAAVTLSSDSRIKVLDAKVVFISDSNEPATAVSLEQVAEPPKQQDEAFIAALASVEPTTEPKATVALSEPSTAPTLAPKVALAESKTQASAELSPELSSEQEPGLTETKQVSEPEPIAIVAVNKVKSTEQSSVNSAESASPAQQESVQVKVKPTPSGPSSLTIKPSELSEPELIALYQKQARTAKSKGDLASAQSRLQKALAIDPRHIEVRKELAALHYGRGEYSQAMAVLDQGVSLVPSNADFRLMQARIYLAGKQQSQALQVLDAISPNVSSNQDFYATKAALAQQLNQDEKALAAYLALARTQPKQGKWWLGLAISQEKLGQTEQALRSYQQAELVGGLSLASMDYVKGRIAGLQ